MKTRIFTLFLVLALLLSLAPAALAYAGPEALDKPFSLTCDGEELTEGELIEDGYTPYVYSAAAGDMVPGSPVDVYSLWVPADAEEVVVTFPQNCLAYNYMPGNQYLAGGLSGGEEFRGRRSYTLKVDANGDREGDYIQVQTPYDANWYSETVYAIKLNIAGPSFTVYVEDEWMECVSSKRKAYTPLVNGAAASPVTLYTVKIPFGTKEIELSTYDFHKVYNRGAGSTLKDTTAAGEQNGSWFHLKVDADGNGRPDILQVMSSDSWGQTSVPEFAVALQYDPDFQDVPAGSWYYDTVIWALESGLTNGTSSTAFSPTKSCTVAEIITFLWRASGEPLWEYELPAGIRDDTWYSEAARWAIAEEVLSPEEFSTTAPCTRAMAVTFMWRASGRPAPRGRCDFDDVPARASYAEAVAWAVEAGITNGVSATAFEPDTVCNRAHIVTFLARYV